MNDSEVAAYLAGFFDADGGVSLYRRSDGFGFALKVYVSQVRPEALKLFHKRFGGRLNGPYENGQGRPIFRWTAYAKEASQMLQALSPYLTNKQDHARLVERYIGLSPKDTKRRTAIYEQIRRLNQRGIQEV